jgi:A/G-specific adenine glycosylase
VEEAARRLVTAMSHEEGAVTPPGGLRPDDWNQALMELGATVCLPGVPMCLVCPWAKTCIGHRAGLAADLPVRREKRASVDVVLRAALLRRGETFLLVRRAEGSLLSGLWELPTTGFDEGVPQLAARVAGLVGADVLLPQEPARSFRHFITHRRITVHVHEALLHASDVREPGDRIAWVRPVDLRDFGVSSMTRKALDGVRTRNRRAGSREVVQ